METGGAGLRNPLKLSKGLTLRDSLNGGSSFIVAHGCQDTLKFGNLSNINKTFYFKYFVNFGTCLIRLLKFFGVLSTFSKKC